ncbi:MULTISPECIES: anti-sigma factor [Chelatococcus]|uniref:Anti-sigma factor (TIGR02949 family) n=1 Tax=Chelatococcus caeni TaxID=1348468 RepID=A0A840C407_9HYPH|nr:MULTISPECIES: zf-HC2 domain-containing protein [Chelatococcus]ALA20329.1 anti-sigma factor [Chelatococcus sp. CO-6]MBB4018348.1 anti-sigma factor (TIGR02949 family) [Chelatococcus caeni]
MPESKNIRCEEVVEHLLTFLDGEEVGEGRRSLIEQHLEECRSCCSRADFELALRHRVREVAAKRPTAILRNRIRQLIDQF